MNLILLEAGEVTAAGEVALGGQRARHVQEVLRATPGQSVRIGIIDGALGTGHVTTIGDGRLTLRCTFGATPPLPRIDLVLALPRPKVMRRLWAQLAALGVGRIILTNAARVERNYFDTHVLSPDCYRPLLIEGLQQARDTHLPRVTLHRQFRVVVEDELAALSDAPVRLLADPGATTSIRDAVRSRQEKRMLLAVGPEGGWNEFEVGLLAAHGFQRVSIGTRTLRSDTACVALLAVVSDAIREFTK